MEKSKKKRNRGAGFIWHYIGRHGFAYAVGIVTLFIVDFVNLYIPQYTGEIIGGLNPASDTLIDKTGIMTLIVKILICATIMMIGRFVWRYALFGSCRKIEYEIRMDLYAHLSTQSPAFYNVNKTGDLMSYFTNDLSAIRQAVGMSVISAFDSTVMLIMVVTKMATYVDWKLTLMCLVPLAVIMFGGIYYGKEAEKRFGEKQAAFSKMSDEVQESISGIRVIKAFVQEEREKENFREINKYNKKMNLRVVSLLAVIIPLLDLLIGISSVITLAYGGYMVVHGEIEVAQFVAFAMYVNQLVWPMLAMGDAINSFSQGVASMKRIGDVLDTEPEIVDTDRTDTAVTELGGEISLHGLSFKYADDLPDVLKDVNVEIKPGESLAIVGRTGSGKSTIANLLLHMMNVPDGMISFDGHDINTIPLKVLRQKIAYVPQDNFLFSDTLQTNIAFGKRDYKQLPKNKKIDKKLILNRRESVEAYLEAEFAARDNLADRVHNDLPEVEAAAKAACIHDNIMGFPNGYATMVGERGVTVSGGQKQRSSIARALMKDSAILILDDALSAVDTDTEENILENLRTLRAGKTTIIIAHRISTIQDCDHIMVLDDGKVAEYGTHEELVALGGEYADLYEKQRLAAAGAYDEGGKQ